jgi:hypothetical protein
VLLLTYLANVLAHPVPDSARQLATSIRTHVGTLDAVT